MTNVNIRLGRKEDMASIFNMIKVLAEVERMSHLVQTSEKMLIREGFEINPPGFTCFVADMDDTGIIGYAMYYYRFCKFVGKTVFLQDLYVDPDYRKYGVSKRLFLEVAKVAYETEGKKLDFYCLSWNPALTFYEKIGAVNITKTEKYHLLRLKEDTLNKMFA